MADPADDDTADEAPDDCADAGGTVAAWPDAVAAGADCADEGRAEEDCAEAT